VSYHDINRHHFAARDQPELFASEVRAAFTWGLDLDGAEPVVAGFDVAVASDVGQLVRVLGKVPDGR
jgi:hypothetical protein